MFHRVYPEIKISPSLLWRTYKKHGVRFKFIHKGKKEIDYTVDYYRNVFTDMFQKVRSARQRDKKIVWVDEAIFSFNTLTTKGWSSKGKSLQVDD